eukprot:Lankesteria_metandrocarpae@DN3006_c0_g1_i1.p1
MGKDGFDEYMHKRLECCLYQMRYHPKRMAKKFNTNPRIFINPNTATVRRITVEPNKIWHSDPYEPSTDITFTAQSGTAFPGANSELWLVKDKKELWKVVLRDVSETSKPNETSKYYDLSTPYYDLSTSNRQYMWRTTNKNILNRLTSLIPHNADEKSYNLFLVPKIQYMSMDLATRLVHNSIKDSDVPSELPEGMKVELKRCFNKPQDLLKQVVSQLQKKDVKMPAFPALFIGLSGPECPNSTKDKIPFQVLLLTNDKNIDNVTPVKIRKGFWKFWKKPTVVFAKFGVQLLDRTSDRLRFVRLDWVGFQSDQNFELKEAGRFAQTVIQLEVGPTRNHTDVPTRSPCNVESTPVAKCFGQEKVSELPGITLTNEPWQYQ